MCFPKRKCVFINIYHLGAITVAAVKVDPFIISTWCGVHYVLNRFQPAHSFLHHQRGWGGQRGKYNCEAMVRRTENYMDPSKYALSCVYRNPTLDLPEPNTKEFCMGSSKEQGSLALQGFCREHSSPLPVHLPLQGVWRSSCSPIKTQLNYLLAQKTFLVQPQREQITLFTAVPLNPLLKQFRNKTYNC